MLVVVAGRNWLDLRIRNKMLPFWEHGIAHTTINRPATCGTCNFASHECVQKKASRRGGNCCGMTGDRGTHPGMILRGLKTVMRHVSNEWNVRTYSLRSLLLPPP